MLSYRLMYLNIASTAPKRAAKTTALVDPTMMKVVVSERTHASQSQPQQPDTERHTHMHDSHRKSKRQTERYFLFIEV